jgi:hypothetical protein
LRAVANWRPARRAARAAVGQNDTGDGPLAGLRPPTDGGMGNAPCALAMHTAVAWRTVVARQAITACHCRGSTGQVVGLFSPARGSDDVSRGSVVPDGRGGGTTGTVPGHPPSDRKVVPTRRGSMLTRKSASSPPQSQGRTRVRGPSDDYCSGAEMAPCVVRLPTESGCKGPESLAKWLSRGLCSVRQPPSPRPSGECPRKRPAAEIARQGRIPQ